MGDHKAKLLLHSDGYRRICVALDRHTYSRILCCAVNLPSAVLSILPLLPSPSPLDAGARAGASFAT